MKTNWFATLLIAGSILFSAAATFAAMPKVGDAAPSFEGQDQDGKTVSLALSAAQYHWLKAAIENWRLLQHTLTEMRRLSREELFSTVPDIPRRKPLSKAVLGTK